MSFCVSTWPNLLSYDLVHSHFLSHSSPECHIWQGNHSSQGSAAWLWAQTASSYLGTWSFPISPLLQNSCAAVCLWVSIQESPKNTAFFFFFVVLLWRGKKNLHKTWSCQRSQFLSLFFMPCNIKSAQDLLFNHSWQCLGPSVSTRHWDHWLWVKPLTHYAQLNCW